MASSTRPARPVAGIGALIMIAVGGWWLLAPAQIPFVGLAQLRISALLPNDQAGWPLLLGGIAGLVLVAVLSRLPVVVGQVASAMIGIGVFAAYQGNGTLSAIGYGLAVCVPLLILVGLVVGLIRISWLRLPLILITVAVAIVGILAGYANPATWQRLLDNLAKVFGGPIVFGVLLTLAVCCAWLWLAVTINPAPFSRLLGWVTAHRRPITIAAACCFLPYAVIRLLWLAGIALDGPLFGVGGLDGPTGLDLGTRLWGASLGVASILGGVAVLGLILRWGETFPRWFPFVGDRRVPILLAVVPGTLAGLAFLAMLPKAMTELVQEFPRSLLTAWVLPFPIWGPLLIMAVAGYLGHRLAQDRVTRAAAGRPR
ncbi:hypothetical protein [Microlunatus speluncae]|uniref:hypothetical protein n=1 Tax=Microlunatus speluncae TaxID=2594267 RepID=UPI001266763D|nr:hypothetical protein [Microlunatus speluncae]